MPLPVQLTTELRIGPLIRLGTGDDSLALLHGWQVRQGAQLKRIPEDETQPVVAKWHTLELGRRLGDQESVGIRSERLGLHGPLL